ncbi:hypothetical protein FQA47_006748 [Oryzias melastigma]|uniref:MYND-type domain-containing protein n=1 Tax=Oryzias melastigma TaxID=30732 RepID=A0A834CKH1_ORYME|nr:hypothetical protein FQA47_006748 [Oryzias melastigma]
MLRCETLLRCSQCKTARYCNAACQVVEINALEVELHTLLSDQMEALLAQTRERIKEQADRLQQLSCESSLCVAL